MDTKDIFENNKKWIKEKLSDNPKYFEELGKGQNPELLFIGCSDSRVTSEELMGLGPGDVFVHRNIANMVISIDLNVMSVVNYAVNNLKVNHVIVCGHYECGGVKAAMQSADLGILNPWLRNIRDVYRIHKNELNHINNPSIKDIRDVVIKIRESKLPKVEDFPNAGSFFKNPVVSKKQADQLKNKYPDMPVYIQGGDQVKIPAGWLIENAGWKGKRDGNTGVHEKQA